MNFYVFCVIVFVAIYIGNILASPSATPIELPRMGKEEGNLLLNLKEIFEALKSTVKDENKSTEDSVAVDVEKMVRRNQDKLSLAKELAFTKIYCEDNKSSSHECPDVRSNIIAEVSASVDKLDQCTKEAKQGIRVITEEINNIITEATVKGQNFINSLYNCSKMPPMEIIPCAKKVIAEDAVPTKRSLIAAIEGHKSAHFKSNGIRDRANLCIDQICSECQQTVSNLVTTVLICKKKPTE